MPSESKFGFSLVGIAEILQGRPLAVPIYQRSYSWGNPDAPDAVRELWTDLRSTFVRPDNEYFLGTIVLSREGPDGRYTIIDGQQRIATTAILLAAIRNEFRRRNDSEPGKTIQSTYLAKPNLRARESVPQVRLNNEDDTYFRNLVIESLDRTQVDATLPSHELILKALTELEDFVRNTADDAAVAWDERLMDWVDYLRDRVRVVVVEVPTESDAFLIFETLNDRGADLTIADLLKNYLFSHGGQRLGIVRDHWLLALGALEIDAGSPLFTSFLRHYWSSRQGATRERELYKSIKETVQTENQAVDLAENLSKAARLYAAILSSDHEFWSDYASVTKGNLDSLGRLDLEQNRPLLLAALQFFSKPEIGKLLRSLVSWSVRGLIMGGVGGGVYERRYCAAAVKIRAGEIKTTTELLSELSPIVPSDDDFKKAFTFAKVTRGTLARYYLSALERQAMGTSEPELVPNEDADQVNLEHVLPKNAREADWSQFTPDERKSYVHRLGNMALLKKSENSRIGNKPFIIKKPILEASALSLTQKGGAVTDWTPTAVDDRQRELADLAPATWPRTP